MLKIILSRTVVQNGSLEIDVNRLKDECVYMTPEIDGTNDKLTLTFEFDMETIISDHEYEIEWDADDLSDEGETEVTDVDVAD